MPNTADILVDTLISWDVAFVFGLPGDGINGVMEALRQRQDRIRFIQTRHEETAAFMATAYAKWTGKLGVCLATSGPGGTHLLTGLYDAKLDQAPVLAITGMQFHDLIETCTQQDVDLTKVFADVAVFNAQVSDAAHMENLAGLACRTALARRGVAHLSIANDIQEKPLRESERSRRNQPKHVPNQWFQGERVPDEEQLDAGVPPFPGAHPLSSLPQPFSMAPAASRSSPGGAPSERARSWHRSPISWPPPSPRRCSARRSCPTNTLIPSAGSAS
jgi:pyruvate dehydrogenase (quinone)